MSKKIQILLFLIASLLALVLGIWLGMRHTAPAIPSTGELAYPTAPLFASTLNDLDGKPQAFAQWQGQWLLINFWAPWCAPCVEEMPDLNQAHQQFSDRKIAFVGIGIDSPSNIRQFLTKVPVSYTLLVGGLAGTDLARLFGNASGGLPFTVLIAPDGKVQRAKLGRIHTDELNSWLQPLQNQ